MSGMELAAHNGFKLALREGRLQTGLWLGLANAYTADVLGGSGFDWLLIDSEHAPNTVDAILGQLQALAGHSVHAVVRSGSDDSVELKRLLDIGATTVLIPMIDSGEQAARAVAACRYPPQGRRGVGAALARASGWNRQPDYLARANDGVCVLLQVESLAGLAALDDICRTDGVDGVFIGPADLAADMGHLGNPLHSEVQQAIEAAIATIAAHGKAPGILMGAEALARRYIALGALFVAVGTDVSLLAQGAQALAARYRAMPAAMLPGQGQVY